MSFYNQAASAVLDMLWDDADFREYFHQRGADLTKLGPLTPEVFVPAYVAVRQSLDAEGLSLLEAQVTEDLLDPYWDRPGFREIWNSWDEQTRNEFIQAQSEEQLARLLVQMFAETFDAAYRAAYEGYCASPR